VSALQGIRVLDFGRFIAGPYCATILAEFGAEVIRIEKPGGGEDRYLAPVMETGEGAVFMHVARNKRALTLDLTSRDGKAIAHRLVKTADIVVTNVPCSALPALGLDYASLQALKTDIIAVNVSAFGDRGPWLNQPGFDSAGQAMSGAAHVSGEPERPFRTQVSWVDYSTALHAAIGAILALRSRDLTGRGQQVGASLLGSAVSYQNPLLIDQMMLGLNRGGLGNRSFASGPTDLFRTKDGWILCQVVSDPIFKRWARLMGEEDLWLKDARFNSDQSRGAHGEILSQRMARWCESRTRDEALNVLAEAKVPAAPVLSLPEVLEHPQVRELGLLTPINYRGQPTPVRVSPVPIEMSETPGEICRGPPTVGEHTDEILSELGISAAEVASLRAARVI
jgi:crotonobetainyl-CoA:carnitine CoA-transferase CaiB-like acyl-CoA transferase